MSTFQFPAAGAPLVDAAGKMTQTGRGLLLELWKRTGGALGLGAAASADATPSTVAPSAAYVQAQAAQVVTDLNAAIASLNDLKAKLRASGALTT